MIERFKIENFRSIKELEIEPKALTAFIGLNSVGKSNVLKALNILLGETYPTERAFNESDFYGRDTSQNITIQVWFDEPLAVKPLTRMGPGGGKAQCAATSLKLVYSRTPDPKTQFIAYNLDGEEFYGSGAVRDQLSFVYVPSDRNLEKQMSVGDWTLLGKILRKIDQNFRKKTTPDPLNQREIEFREAMNRPKELLESDLSEDLSFKTFKETFIEICKDNTKGLASDFDLDLEIYDPLFYYKTIQILGRETMGSFNVQELGSGVQNLVLLSLFRTYAKLMKSNAVLAIEEPEIYLYPQAQRQLYRSFRDLAYPSDNGPGTQLFYTTHNPSFLDALHPEEIEILSRTEDGGTGNCPKSRTFEINDKAKFKIYTHFNSDRNELFFANKVLLVEGASDRIMWNTLAEQKWGINLDKEGISVIECGGKGGVLYFCGVCKLSGINSVFAVWDQDEDIDDAHGLLQEMLTSGRGLEIPDNLERFLGARFHDRVFGAETKVQNAYKWASTVAVSDIPTEFELVHNFMSDEREPEAASVVVDDLEGTPF